MAVEACYLCINTEIDAHRHFMLMERQHSAVCRILSVIAYIRNFFSEEAFVTSRENGMRMKTVVLSPESARYVEWIRAIESKIDDIHRIVLGVYDENHSVVEMYSVDMHSAGDMREMCIGLQRLSSLPRNVTVRLKVYSYVVIKMKGFKAGNETWGGGMACVGTVGGLSIYTGGAGKDDKRMTDRGGVNGELDCTKVNGELGGSASSNRGEVDHNGSVTGDNRNGSQTGARHGTNTCPRSDINSINNNSRTGSASTGDRVRCTCGIAVSDGDMIQCDVCSNWLHTVCAGYFSNRDRRIPRVYECLYCTDKVNKRHRNASVYRRILAIIYNEGCCTQVHIRNRLGIGSKYTAALYRRLCQDGLVRVVNKKYEVIADGKARVKVKEYFSAKALECSMSAEEIGLSGE